MFNERLTGLPSEVVLDGKAEHRVEKDIEIVDPSTPWLLLIVPDGLGSRLWVGRLTELSCFSKGA
jgi:hypothetical protein